MGIGINAIGNYGMFSSRINPTRKVAQTIKTQQTSSLGKTQSNSAASVITEKEKEFFVNRYPNQKEMIMNYHFYQRNGEVSGVAVGSIINRRG